MIESVWSPVVVGVMIAIGSFGIFMGIWDTLDKHSDSNLVIVGTEDAAIPAANSLMLAGRIPRAWLVQINRGHRALWQYPEEFDEVLKTFLTTTKYSGE